MIHARSFFQPPVGVPVSIAVSTPDRFPGLHLDVAKPPWVLVQQYRNDGDWPAYRQQYEWLLGKRERPLLAALSDLLDSYGEVTVCCWCHDPATCHRSLLAAWAARHGLPVSDD